MPKENTPGDNVNKPVRPRRLVNSSNEIINVSKESRRDTEQVIEHNIKEQIKKTVKIYNKLSSLEEEVDNEYASLKIPVIQSHSSLIKVVQRLDPQSNGLYISYTLYKDSLAKQSSLQKYQNVDVADDISGIQEVDGQVIRKNKAERLDIGSEIATVLATTLGMQVLAILKNSGFMRGATGLQTSKYGGVTTGPALAADLAQFALTMALEYGSSQLPQVASLLDALGQEFDGQAFEQGATFEGVQEREDGRQSQDKAAELIHGNPLEDHEVIVDYVASYAMGIGEGAIAGVASFIPKGNTENNSASKGANAKPGVDTSRLLYKPLITGQKSELENFHKQQRTWHPEQVKIVQKELGERHTSSDLRATPELTKNSEPDDVWSKNNLPNPGNVDNPFVDVNLFDQGNGEKANSRFNYMEEKHNFTDGYLNSINKAADVMAYSGSLINKFPVELICCLSKFFSALDLDVLKKIRFILSLSTNGIKLDLESVFKLLQKKRNESLTRLILEPIIDLINKLFDTVLDEIRDWLSRDLEKWDDAVNNCLSLDFVIEYIVEYIRKKEKEFLKLIENHFDQLLSHKKLGIGVLRIKADHDILRKLLKLINAVIDAKKRQAICRENQDEPTQDELEGFIRSFIADTATPFKLPKVASGDPFLSFNNDFDFATSLNIDLPIDISEDGVIDTQSEDEAAARIFADCAKKISPELVVQFTEFRGRIRDIDDELQ